MTSINTDKPTARADGDVMFQFVRTMLRLKKIPTIISNQYDISCGEFIVLSTIADSIRGAGKGELCSSDVFSAGEQINLSDLYCMELNSFLAGVQSAGFIGFSDVQKALNISKAALSQVLSILERKKYVNRQPDPKDRRRIMLSLTPEGYKNLNSLYSKIMNNLNEIISRFGEENMLTFLKLFNSLADVSLAVEKDLSEDR